VYSVQCTCFFDRAKSFTMIFQTVEKGDGGPPTQRHILRDKRTSTAACPLPSLLGDGDKGIEIVYGEEKNYFVLGRLEQPRQNKISFTVMTSPTNQLRMDPFHSYSLSPHTPLFQQSAGATPFYSLSAPTFPNRHPTFSF
jgi:hypothetical protein